jgi:RNA polymerase sigma-70 factor, ECF subfamily
MVAGNPLASGDHAAWSALIAAVHPDALLVMIHYRMGAELRLRVAAEDLLQETLLKAWRGRTGFDWQGAAQFRGWIIQIAQNCIEDERDRIYTRKRARTTIPLGVPGADDSSRARDLDPAASTTPALIAEMREYAHAMQVSLDALGEDVREVVRLRLFEDLSFDQIAAALGIGESAARHRFRRGVKTYRKRLNALLPDSSSFWRHFGSEITSRGHSGE